MCCHWYHVVTFSYQMFLVQCSRKSYYASAPFLKDFIIYCAATEINVLLKHARFSLSLFRDLCRNLVRWTAIDHSTQQAKMVSFCVEWPSKAKADSFYMVVHQAMSRLDNEELKHRGKKPTHGVGDGLLPRPTV